VYPHVGELLIVRLGAFDVVLGGDANVASGGRREGSGQLNDWRAGADSEAGCCGQGRAAFDWETHVVGVVQ